MPGELSDLLKLWDRTDVLDAIVDEGEAGLPDVARPATVAGLARRVSPLLVVLPRSRDAEAVAQALAPWVSEGRVELFPAWEVLPGEAMSPTLETMGRRMRILAELSGDEIASLRTFSVSSQRSRGEAGEVEILPVRELLLSPETMERARRLLDTEEAPRDRQPPSIAADDLGEGGEEDEETDYLR